MTQPTPPVASSSTPPGAAASQRAARVTVLLVAAGLAIVATLVVGIVSMSRWGYTELRTQARTSQNDAAGAAPPVVGPVRPAPRTEASPVRDASPPSDGPLARATPDAAPTPGEPAGGSPRTAGAGASLQMPVDGVAPTSLYPSFDEARGARRHEAIDIMAPRGTPVRAAVDGRVVKLFTSDAGGLTLYQFDREERLAYYYAHLDRYEAGLREGAELKRGDVLGYVGSTGNASADAPHLHFAVFELGPEKRWWEGRAIDPYPLLGGRAR